MCSGSEVYFWTCLSHGFIRRCDFGQGTLEHIDIIVYLIYTPHSDTHERQTLHLPTYQPTCPITPSHFHLTRNVNMPILRSLTLKIKTKLSTSPPASPTIQSPSSSFEAVGRKEMQRARAQTTNGSMESVSSRESAVGSLPAVSPLVKSEDAMDKAREERMQRRRSKFREEL